MALDLTAIDLSAETVRTERLLLRPPEDRDVDPITRACQDPGNQRWLSTLPSPYTRADAVEFVTGVAPRGRASGTDVPFAVEADGELVAMCGLHELTTGRLGPEIGPAPVQGPDPSSRGLGGTGVLRLFTDVANTASQAVARRAGFTEEGVVRSCLSYRDGSRADAVLFGRLAP
jgi:RimJ/RimL family protein N-acetyltransferase